MVGIKKSKNAESVMFTTLLPQELNTRLREFTERTGIKIKAFVAQAIKEKLEREIERQNLTR